MAGIRIEGNTSANVVEVTNNNEMRVATTTTIEDAGFVAIASENDAGSVTGTRMLYSPETTDDFRLRVGIDNIAFNELFPGSTLNTSVWTAPTSSMTVSVASGFLVLNAGNTLSASAFAQVTSKKYFQTFKSFALYFEASVQFPYAPVTNNVTEWGFGIAAGTSTPTDGAFFRLTAGGSFVCVVNYNGSETTSSALNFNSLVGINTTKQFIITIGRDDVYFWIGDDLVAIVDIPAAGAALTSSYSLPVFFRTYNSGLTAQAQQIRVGVSAVAQGDMAMGKQWADVLSGLGWSATQWTTGSGSLGSTAQWANNTVPASAQPTNTTAALGTGLGGIFLAQVNGLAAGTDYIISSFQIPVATSTVPGRNLYINDVVVAATWTGATNAATIQTFTIGLCYGHTAVSLATTETAISKAPRRMILGTMTVPASAAIGTLATPTIEQNLRTAIAVYPGEYIQVVMRYINYTSVNNAVLHFNIKLNGYWE